MGKQQQHKPGADPQMNDKPKILVVDDDAFTRDLIAEVLGADCNIAEASNGDECLAAAAGINPDVILLDVEMPGIDGYETCRRLKADLALNAIPVLFVSGHDEIPERLRGYDAGAEDYIVKPFALQELQAKVKALTGKLSRNSQLEEMASYASRTAMTAMSSMGEMGSLLQTLQAFNTCETMASLVDATIAGLSAYGLAGAVQIRHDGGALTRASQGDASPLEASVIGHMAGMERIVQFRNRLSITYPRVSLLVSNMPTEDADRCGRLRDHLAVLVESAEVRVDALLAAERAQQRTQRIAAAVEQITGTLDAIDADLRVTRAATSVAVQELTTRLERSYVHLALTESQEEYLAGIVSAGVTGVLDAQLKESGQQDRMTSIVRELHALLHA